MESPSVDSSFGAVGGMFWNITTDNYRLRHLLQTEESLEKAPVFVDYMPPSRDGIALPRYVLYILMGTAVIIVALYGIVGHLIKELIHDFTDWALGWNPVECDEYERLGEKERKSSGSKARALGENQRGPLPGLQIEL